MDILEIEGGGVRLSDTASSLLEHADGSLGTPFPVEFDINSPSGFAIGGTFRMECVRQDGTTRWVSDLKNGVTNQALDDVLNVYLGTGTKTTTWYLMLVDNASFTAFSATDTPASHAGWVENQSYSNSTRPAWTLGSSSGQTVTNGTSVNFNMNPTIGSPVTIRGLALISANDKGGGAGGQILFATAAFTGGNQVCANGDTLKVTYTVSAAST